MKINIGMLFFVAITQCGTVLGAASFFGIGDLDGGPFDSSINAVNSDGTVFVGTGTSESAAEAFVWTRSDGFQRLGQLPGGLASFGNGVSADGSYVVGHSTTASGNTAFVWNALTGMVALPRLPGGLQATAEDVSADGKLVVGGSDSFKSTDINMEAARWDSGVVSVIGDLPGGSVEGVAHAVSDSGSVIVGYSISGEGLEAFSWSQADGLQGFGDLPTNPFSLISEAMAVSATGQYIAGYARGKSGYYEATVWSEFQGISSLGRRPLDLYGTFARGVSDDGTIVVGKSNDRAFIWTEADGLVDLKDALEKNYGLDLTGWTLIDATDISDDGTTIVGSARRAGQVGIQGFVAVIPEPHVKTYIAFSFVAVGLLRIRTSSNKSGASSPGRTLDR